MTVDLITKLAAKELTGVQYTQCGDAGQSGDTRPGWDGA